MQCVMRRRLCWRPLSLFRVGVVGGGSGGNVAIHKAWYSSSRPPRRPLPDDGNNENDDDSKKLNHPIFDNEEDYEQWLRNFKKLNEELDSDMDTTRKRGEIENHFRKELGMPLQDPKRPIVKEGNPDDLETAAPDRASIRCFMFPGQGSQRVGMGKDLIRDWPAASYAFDEVDEALGERLTATMWNGPREELARTENAQPAIVALSWAMWTTVMVELQVKDPRVLADVLIGHSLGLYSALCCAGSLRIAPTVQLVRMRGMAMTEAMESWGEGRRGGMLALLGCSVELAYALADIASRKTGLVCDVANINTSNQIVLSGDMEALHTAAELGRAGVQLRNGGKRETFRRHQLLDVSAPFHCRLMGPAQETYAHTLHEMKVEEPLFPVLSDIDGQPLQDVDHIREVLLDQFVKPVDWPRVVNSAIDREVNVFYEMGAAKVLTPLTQRIVDERFPARPTLTDGTGGDGDEQKTKKQSSSTPQPSSKPTRQALANLARRGGGGGGSRVMSPPLQQPQQQQPRMHKSPSSSTNNDQRQQQSKKRVIYPDEPQQNDDGTLSMPNVLLPVTSTQYREDFDVAHVGSQQDLLETLNYLAIDLQNSFVSRHKNDPEMMRIFNPHAHEAMEHAKAKAKEAKRTLKDYEQEAQDAYETKMKLKHEEEAS